MSSYQEIKDYIYYNSKPFTSSKIVVELGICYETVKKYIQALISEGYIKKIGVDKGKNVYIYNRNHGNPTQYKVDQKHYTFEDIKETYRRQLKKRREEFLDLL